MSVVNPIKLQKISNKYRYFVTEVMLVATALLAVEVAAILILLG